MNFDNTNSLIRLSHPFEILVTLNFNNTCIAHFYINLNSVEEDSKPLIAVLRAAHT